MMVMQGKTKIFLENQKKGQIKSVPIFQIIVDIKYTSGVEMVLSVFCDFTLIINIIAYHVDRLLGLWGFVGHVIV